MSKPKIQIGDQVREMTDAEYKQYLADAAEAKAQEKAVDETVNAEAAARKSALKKLAALGLTDAEIAALVGA